MKLFSLYIICLVNFSKADYWEERRAFIKSEESLIVGSDIELTDSEKLVNKILMDLKCKELDKGFVNPGQFLPAEHFFRSRDSIKTSKVFQFIQKLPKGCALHGHDFALTSFDFIYNATFRDDLYGCISNNTLKLHFFKSPVTNKKCNWTLIRDWRAQNSSFDDWLKTQMTIIVPNPEETYPTVNAVWRKFMSIFPLIEPLLTYKVVFQEQFYQFLQELYEDNVRYAEFRGYLPSVYDLDGHRYNQLETVGLYVETLQQFMSDYKEFQGVRLIYAPHRGADNKTMDEYIKTVLELKAAYPTFIAGFDLVGQEDLGRPLIEFVPKLQKLGKQMHLFFHAGETKWYGESTDLNVIDAILLGTKRIGHGYALLKHPKALKVIKDRGIAVEINPISNQVLKLVDDIRNHPGCALIAQGYPIVISNDDPGLWGAKGLSFDWYIAFAGMTSRNTDLRFLKRLALNSYLYNAMDPAENQGALQQWENEWNSFINQTLQMHGYPEYKVVLV